MDLETILQKFGYKKVLKKDGTLTVSGSKAYGKIIDLMYNLADIGVITEHELNEITTKLDKVCDEQIY